MDKEPITLNGLNKLKEELIFLKEKKRPKIVAAIAEARSHGDLKENAEYHAAKEEQSHNEGRITEINDIIARANVIDVTKFSNDGKIIFGSTVNLENLDNGENLEYKIVYVSILLSGLEGDERRMIDTTMTKLRSLVERTGISLFLVSHLRRSSNDRTSHEEGGRVTLSSLRGSHSIAQISDSVCALEVDQQSDSDRKLTTLRVLKNRYSGETGIATTLNYDLSNCRFSENETSEPSFLRGTSETTDF